MMNMSHFFGEGDQVPGQTTGNLIFVLRPAESDRNCQFRRKENDLLMDYDIPLIGALTGHQFIITLLNDQNVYLQTQGIIKPGEILRVVGLGMPIKHQPESYGNLIIKFTVVFPDELSPEQDHLLNEALIKKPLDIPPNTEWKVVEKIHSGSDHEMNDSSSDQNEQETSCSIQ